jgi:putative ABC transport system permease protein
MLNKLALAGIKNRFRDYAVLFSGLIIGSAIFYMFMTLATNRDFQNANSSISATPFIFMFGAVLLTIITFVYIIYANNFLLSMRKHDYATFMMLGAKSSKISSLIFTETMVIGLGATVVGLALGVGATALVGKFLMQALDATASHFAPFYLPAILTTAIFFVILFLLAAIVNAAKMRRTPVLELLRADSTPSRSNRKNWQLALSAVAGIASLAIGYWAMAEIAVLKLMSIPIAMVTIVLGSYLLFNAVVVAVIKLLKRNQNFANKGLRNFTLSQISFRVRSYTAILSVVSILFALALGAITVGLGFYNEVPALAQNFNSYALVQHDPSAKDVAAAKELTGAYGQANYQVKSNKQVVTLRQSDLQAHPLIANQANGDDMLQKKVRVTTKELTATPQKYIEAIDSLLVKARMSAGAKVQVVSDGTFAQTPGTAQTVRVYRVHDLRANAKTLTKLQNVENKKFPALAARGVAGSTAASYALFNAFCSGFAFMGFFLGIAFLAMLASTLMFKILSGADYDKNRYQMLRKMGVREKLLRGSIRHELFTLFALPGVLGVVHVLFGLKLFTSLLLNPYDKLYLPFGIFIVLYLLYYLVTVWLYEGIVLRQNDR